MIVNQEIIRLKTELALQREKHLQQIDEIKEKHFYKEKLLKDQIENLKITRFKAINAVWNEFEERFDKLFNKYKFKQYGVKLGEIRQIIEDMKKSKIITKK